MSEYSHVRTNGQITLPAGARRTANLKEGDLLEVLVEADGSIRLVPRRATDWTWAEKDQLDDADWALKQTGIK